MAPNIVVTLVLLIGLFQRCISYRSVQCGELWGKRGWEDRLNQSIPSGMVSGMLDVAEGEATVYVPRGSFLIKPVVFSGPCRSSRVTFQMDDTGTSLVAPSNYWELGNSGTWILFIKVTGLSVYGGTVDARDMRIGNAGDTERVARQEQGQTMHMAIDNCKNVVVKNVKITAPSSSPNTDGIHIEASTGVTISGSTIMTGDDCISIGSGSKNLWLERIACGPGHGISIGSLGDNANEDGVQNVTVTSCVFTKTQNGVRIKTWARASNGYATNIVFRNLIMQNVNNPIIIDQKYCPGNQGCPRQSSGVKISRVTYTNIRGTSASKVAMNFYCSSSNPCWGLKLQDIRLTYLNKAATSYCANAGGSSSGVVIPRSCF
ncbi:polygalacturonase [Prunus yedoensis var. nudiflora]|uniref:Polygalacturonase n=1 Tax=Prunus yedoensis var. nudiflora TaxID=2094558 RepID=A0A314YG38_PRUYE|nr:polygalacturonase [Prunus yedoensis var. nudiflora]